MSSHELKRTNRRVAWMNGQRDQQKRSRKKKKHEFHSVFTLNVVTVSVCRCSMRQWGPWCTTLSPWPERTWKSSKLYASSSASAAATTTSTLRLPESWVRTVKTIMSSHAKWRKMSHTVTHFMTIFNITCIDSDLFSWYAHFFGNEHLKCGYHTKICNGVGIFNTKNDIIALKQQTLLGIY